MRSPDPREPSVAQIQGGRDACTRSVQDRADIVLGPFDHTRHGGEIPAVPIRGEQNAPIQSRQAVQRVGPGPGPHLLLLALHGLGSDLSYATDAKR